MQYVWFYYKKFLQNKKNAANKIVINIRASLLIKGPMEWSTVRPRGKPCQASNEGVAGLRGGRKGQGTGARQEEAGAAPPL